MSFSEEEIQSLQRQLESDATEERFEVFIQERTLLRSLLDECEQRLTACALIESKQRKELSSKDIALSVLRLKLEKKTAEAESLRERLSKMTDENIRLHSLLKTKMIDNPTVRNAAAALLLNKREEKSVRVAPPPGLQINSDNIDNTGTLALITSDAPSRSPLRIRRGDFEEEFLSPSCSPPISGLFSSSAPETARPASPPPPSRAKLFQQNNAREVRPLPSPSSTTFLTEVSSKTPSPIVPVAISPEKKNESRESRVLEEVRQARTVIGSPNRLYSNSPIFQRSPSPVQVKRPPRSVEAQGEE